MIEKEMICSSHSVIECWHGFRPFHKVIEIHNNIFIIVVRRRVIVHEINGKNGLAMIMGCNGARGVHALGE
jgi:hypothetical protein